MTASIESDRPEPWPSSAGLLADQVRSNLVQFVRIPVALFFTLVLPLLMLVLFNTLFAGDEAVVEGPVGEWPLRQFYVGSLAAFTAVSGTFTNLVNMIPSRRETGVMKRWRGTPLPDWVYLAGFVGSAVVIALGGVVIMLGVGVAFYGTEVDPAKMPAAAVAFLMGVIAFSALGVAVSGLVRKADAAPAVANAVILPLGFISNVFVAVDQGNLPTWLDWLSSVLPLRPFVESMQGAFNPTVEPPAFNWSDLAVLAAWSLIGVAIAWKFFKWEPLSDDGRAGRAGAGRHRRRDPKLIPEVG